MKHVIVHDLDGSVLGGSGGVMFSRAELFSANSFFGLPFKDPANHNYMRSRYGIPSGDGMGGSLGASSSGDEGWGGLWYPTVPQQMWTDRAGKVLQMNSTWLQRGFGIPREGCTLKEGWNCWQCPSRNYSRLIIENMDADHEIRRISPVALSADGYTDLLNGCMDHGWCMSYTCLKRLMTFWAVVKTGTVSTVHFAATTPQGLRVFLPYAPLEEKLILRIYYPGNMRLQVYVGERYVEDLNRLDGKSKEQLVLDGRLSSNNDQGGYTQQTVSLLDPCRCACSVDFVRSCCVICHTFRACQLYCVARRALWERPDLLYTFPVA